MNIRSEAREVFDVCGAGGTVISVLTYTWACQYSLEDCVKLANKAAGAVVGRVGTFPVRYEEVFDNGLRQ